MLNLRSTIYQTGWLDLVFANRNKSYGAYELRRNYNKRLGRAMIISFLSVATLFSYPFIKQQFNIGDVADSPVLHDDEDIIVVALPPLPQKKEQAALPRSSPKSDPVKVKTRRFGEPVVVSTPVTENPPTMTELKNSSISTQNSDGIETSSNVSLAGNGTGKGGEMGDMGGDVNEPIPVGLLEKYPEFPGGMEAFTKFLRRNLRYPDRAAEAEIGGKVFVSFVVEKDGRLTDIKVLKGIGYGCDEEAARVLKKSPAWRPGLQNNKEVRVLYTIPMVFQLGE